MKGTLKAIYDLLIGDSELETILTNVRVYAVQRPRSDVGFPYIIIGLETNNDNQVIFTHNVAIDIYDNSTSAEDILKAGIRIQQLLDRTVLSTDSQYAEARFETAGMVPEEADSGILHWSANFSVRADKKEVIGG